MSSCVLFHLFPLFFFCFRAILIVFSVSRNSYGANVRRLQCRTELTVCYAGPDDDVRENINYEDEFGGEDDMPAYDITPLQIPIGGQGLSLVQGYDTTKGGKIPCKFFLFTLKLPFGE